MKKAVCLLLFVIVHAFCMAQTGTWRNHLAYHDIQQIEKAGDDLFVMASNNLYLYSLNDQSIFTYDKTNGMSDVGLRHIRWCPQAQRLVAVYENANIDLVSPDGEVTNVSDLYLKTMTGDKTVSSIRIDGIYAYLICGFGIVKLNVRQAEITDSYTPGHPDYPTLLSDDDNSAYNEYIETVRTLQPDGPRHNYFGYLRFHEQQLFCTYDNWDITVPGSVLVYDGKEWTVYPEEGISQVTGVSYENLLCVDVDPLDARHLFAGARNGLYEYRDGAFVNYYNYTNSPIERYDGKNKEYELVTGVKFDNEGNLWFLNSQAPTTSLVKYNDGTFTKYNKPTLMTLNDGGFTNKSNGNMSKMITDRSGNLWFVNNNWFSGAVYRYDISNDVLTTYSSFINQNSVRLDNIYRVRCVAEDRDGNMWVGTDAGLLVLMKEQMDDADYYFTQVIVPRNDGSSLGDYLLSNIDITAIAIDDANRKWIATATDGVFLISADNTEQIHHFTTDNSPLLSNYVTSVAINPQTGEVFFGATCGLCSYMSDATQSATEMTKSNVTAYPNPVTPGYTGLITVTGLSFDADVKILSPHGLLVAQGRSNGGLFTWDGLDTKGRRVGSGVYMVVTATSGGEKGTVCKIAVIN